LGKGFMDYTKSAVANTYSRFPLHFVEGNGCYLKDITGRNYLDFTSGIAVCSMGHCNREINHAVKRQLDTLVHVSNLYWTDPQAEVAELLTSNSFADRVFFCNSGAEANEAAIKLARIRGHNLKGPECYRVVSLQGSFHGRTIATITATGQTVYQKGFDPLLSGFTHVPPNDIGSLRLAVDNDTAAVILEPVQGEGGVVPLEDEFLVEARRLCDETGALLIFDEVQVGMGRTGTLFAYEQTPVVPDVLCLAKALANGLPIGAMMAGGEVMKHLAPGTHASTFGGNPAACAAAAAVIKEMTAPGFLEKVRERAARLVEGLERIASEHDELVLEVRGRGMIQAVVFRQDMPDLAMKFIEKGVLVLVGHGRILRLLPPLVAGMDEIEIFIDRFKEILG
jgi:predicted acetylornithine/succinylornithine family transaminase